MSTLGKIPRWQTERAAILHAEFGKLEAARQAEKIPLLDALLEVSQNIHGRPLDNGKRKLRATTGGLKTLYYRWTAGGRKASALVLEYTCGGSAKTVPDALKAEIQRLASSATGGRDKNQNGRSAASIHKELTKKWMRGENIPGLGTWPEWWANTYPAIAKPHKAPQFPFCYETVKRHTGAKVLRVYGAIGRAAANKHMPHISMDYSQLRRCELYMMDDVRLDLIALDEVTGRVVEITCYVLMEVSSRFIVSYVLKPKGHIKAEDVDEMLAHGLSSEGFGLGDGYTTHLYFERGTIACSEAAQMVLEAGSDGAIKVHRTSMLEGVRWAGAAPDKAVGHAAGKGAMEAFNRKLHDLLIDLPGQRGNNWANQPANLGVGEREVKDPSASTKNTVVMAAERIAQFIIAAREQGEAFTEPLPLLTINGLRAEVTKRINEYNHEAGHDMQGFHYRTEAEISPGVWQPLQSSI